MGVILGLVLLVLQLLVVAVAALHRLVRAPSQRRPLLWVWLTWNVWPAWLVWRALTGWVLRQASAAATRACDAHERAQATATYPAEDHV